jgi:hypothetical protein
MGVMGDDIGRVVTTSPVILARAALRDEIVSVEAPLAERLMR